MNEIKSIYIKLLALNVTLLSRVGPNAIVNDGSWGSFNQLLGRLEALTQDDYYSTLKVKPMDASGDMPWVLVSSFGSKVYQAAHYLYATRKSGELSDQYPPESPKARDGEGMTQTAIFASTQENAQSQTSTITIEFNQTLTYMTEAIVEARGLYSEGTKERTFLNKLKEGISTAKSTAELIKMIMLIATQYGLTVAELAKIFK